MKVLCYTKKSVKPSMPFSGVKQSDGGLPENNQTGLEFFVDRKAVYLRG